MVAQVAGSLVLLVAAGLFLRSLANARAIDAGFDPEGALVFSLDLGAQGYDAARGGRFYTALQERLEHVPGVEAVGLANLLPLSLGAERRGLRIEGYTPGPGEDLEVHSSFVGPGYFRAMRGRIARGREFEAHGHARRTRRRDRQRGLRAPLLAGPGRARRAHRDLGPGA